MGRHRMTEDTNKIIHLVNNDKRIQRKMIYLVSILIKVNTF